MKFFDEMGEKVLSQWSRHHMDLQCFPDIAAEAFAQMDPVAHVDWKDILSWALKKDALPTQPDLGHTFGRPPIALFYHHKFSIDALFWQEDSHIVVHDHGFSAAFCPLLGKRIEAKYGFHSEKRINNHLEMGHVERQKTEILEPGNIRSFFGGPGYIHEIIHLDVPSVTLVMRTRNISVTSQWRYYLPCLGLKEEKAVTSDIQRNRELYNANLIFGFKRRQDNAGFHKVFKEFLMNSDPIFIVELILSHREHYDDKPELFADLLFDLAEKHGPLIKAMFSIIDYQNRREYIQYVLSLIKDPEARLILASLVGCENRSEIIDLIKMWQTSIPPPSFFIDNLKKIKKAIENADAQEDNQISKISEAGFEIISRLFQGNFSLPQTSAQEYEQLKKVKVLKPIFVDS